MFGSLLGRTSILKYKILFDDNDKVTAEVNSLTTPIKKEYCMFYFLYLTKNIYNFGGKSSTASIFMLENLIKILYLRITPNTNCFKSAGVDDVITYTDKVENAVTELSGEFYAWKNGNRTIRTNFPLNVTEQQAAFGGLAILQYAINENKENKKNLEFLQIAGENILEMYKQFDGSNSNDISGIPISVFNKLEVK